jgi:glycine/serine hydroxymethyltransferase
MIKIAEWMDTVFKNAENPEIISQVKKEIEEMCEEFPVPGIE